MIQKKNLKKLILDLEGSSYVTFILDIKVKHVALGDFYWQDGDKMEIQIDSLDRQEEFTGSEKLTKFLSREAIDYIEELYNDSLYNLI